MSFIQIPIPATTVVFDLQVDLDTVLLQLSFVYYPRDSAWRVTISRSGVTLLSHLKVVTDSDLLAQYRYIEELPPGRLIIFDNEGLGNDPNDSNFGDRVIILYEPI